ncbi:MAG: uroporphyrinogen-III synthase [Terriglobales bacterium]
MSAPALPLSGRRIVVTRAAEQAGELLAGLRAQGAEAIALPTIAFAPPGDWGPLDAALSSLAAFDGCVFTSANAVSALFARAEALGMKRSPPRGWVAAVGPATAAALASHAGWAATIVPARSSAEGVVEALAGRVVPGARILFPHAEAARDLVPEALRAQGAEVVAAACYRTVAAESERGAALALFPGVDATVLTSPSTARNLAALLGEDHRRRMQGVAVVVIGPVTRAAAGQLGWSVAAEAHQPGAAALIAALREFWGA